MKGQGNGERGNVLTMVLVGIIILLATTNAAAVTLALMNHEQYAPAAPAAPQVQAADTSDDSRLLDNQNREDDAVLVADGVANFYSNNIGVYPTVYTGGNLTAPGSTKPQPVQLTFYHQFAVVSGPQKPIDGDNVRLVTKAACAESGGATVAPKANTYSYVVQYTSQPKGGGSLETKCFTPRS